MFRARGIGNYGDYYTPEGFVPGSKENTEVPWFVIYPLGRTFSYETEASEHKGAKWIVYNIIDCAAKGGNFMLGVGPDENGKFHPTAIEQMKKAGKWLKINGNSIYSTRSREGENWKEGENIRFTKSKDNKTVYVHFFEWNENQLILKTLKPKKGANISLLGEEPEKLSWRYDKERGLIIKTPLHLKKIISEEGQLAYSLAVEL
jgi:alpha-L-fucosidase